MKMKRKESSTAFSLAVSEATQALRVRDIPSSRSKIASAIMLDMDAPEPHNLLGILYEMMGDDNAARKHYRAAYALDPTFKPSCRNLERLVVFNWGVQQRNFDFGIEVDMDQVENLETDQNPHPDQK